jgi:hypothetical protein
MTDRDHEALEWTWERAIAALKRLHDSPERWGWRYTMHALGVAETQTARLEESRGVGRAGAPVERAPLCARGAEAMIAAIDSRKSPDQNIADEE